MTAALIFPTGDQTLTSSTGILDSEHVLAVAEPESLHLRFFFIVLELFRRQPHLGYLDDLLFIGTHADRVALQPGNYAIWIPLAHPALSCRGGGFSSNGHYCPPIDNRIEVSWPSGLGRATEDLRQQARCSYYKTGVCLLIEHLTKPPQGQLLDMAHQRQED